MEGGWEPTEAQRKEDQVLLREALRGLIGQAGDLLESQTRFV